jgi:hypothetical protein
MRNSNHSSFRFCVATCLALILVGAFVGCGHGKAPTNTRMFVLSGIGLDSIEITINGQPADGGGWATYFVTNGNNTVKMIGSFDESYGGNYQFTFGRCETIWGKGWEQIWKTEGHPTGSDTNVTLQFSFDANVPWHWKWEDADTLTQLSDADKAEITKMFDATTLCLTNMAIPVEQLWRNEDFVPWIDDEVRIRNTQSICSNLVAEVRAYSDLTSSVSKHDDLVFLRGTKVVALRSLSGNLYYVGHGYDYHPANGEMVHCLASTWMYFGRFNGKWKQILIVQ